MKRSSFAQPLGTTATPAQAAVIFGALEHACVLESSLPDSSYGRYSIFAADPLKVVVVPADAGAPLDDLLRQLELPTRRSGTAATTPFGGGWFGYLSYEAGLATEGIRATTERLPGVPACVMALYDTLAMYDHTASAWLAITPDLPDHYAPSRSRAERIERVAARLELAARTDPIVRAAPQTADCVARTPTAAYLSAVARAKRYIAAGDVYQVNVTQRWDVRTAASPAVTYARLRTETPAPHAALLRFGETSIISASPELFLRAGGEAIVTRPIKGTRRRDQTPAGDRAARAELARSEKDRAELNMIIDLLRNDLGRVAALGSVRVIDADCIEQHPTLFHRVATIEARLRSDATLADVLRATFPGGSVTGAPKFRAMQIIDELETVARGPYCGAIGWFGLDGSMALNLAIRTMTQHDDQVHVHAGGAIVADSEPHDEYNETLAKAAAMFRALGCRSPEPLAPQHAREVLSI